MVYFYLLFFFAVISSSSIIFISIWQNRPNAPVLHDEFAAGCLLSMIPMQCCTFKNKNTWSAEFLMDTSSDVTLGKMFNHYKDIPEILIPISEMKKEDTNDDWRSLYKD